MKQIKSWAQYYVDLMTKLGLVRFSMFLATAIIVLAVSIQMGVTLFLRGTVPLVGFKSAVCEYERAERMAGESKYPLSKMLALAVNGITSLSVKPLRLITGIGLLVSLFSFLGALWALIAWAAGHTISGWTSMTVALFFLSGIQLLSLGVIGEYIGKIYSETKERPLYLIADSTLKDSDEDKVLHTETETRAIR